MNKFNVFTFVIKSVFMGMIAAIFLFVFFPHLMSPALVQKENANEVIEHLSFADAIEKTSPSVVNIRTFIKEARGIKIGVGSGVIISKQGYIITNYHVIAKAEEIAVELTDGRSSIAEVIGFDDATDLAVLKVSMDKLPSIKLTTNVSVKVGDIALVIGNPFGAGQSVTMGIISATGRRHLGLVDIEYFLQTDAAVNPGNSGGALINTKGDLLGITSAYFTRGTKSGISYSIPISQAMDVIEQIIFNGRVIRGWLGFEAGPINKQGRDKFGDDAYIVKAVGAGGPAEKAGLKANDVILAINNKELADIPNLQSLITESAPGSEIIFKINRAEKVQSLTATVEERPLPKG